MANINWNIVPPFFQEAFIPGTFQTVRDAQEFAYLIVSRLRAAIKAGYNGSVSAEKAVHDPFWQNWSKMLRLETVTFRNTIRCYKLNWG